jgi:hypothetical protein
MVMQRAAAQGVGARRRRPGSRVKPASFRVSKAVSAQVGFGGAPSTSQTGSPASTTSGGEGVRAGSGDQGQGWLSAAAIS